jgi:hypothetical protein
MTMRFSTAAGLGLLVLACSGPEATYTQYGEALTIAETTSIPDILADPDSYVGEQVRVEGKVVEVCQSMGCWMALTARDSSDPLRVKVEDGVIVFPQTAVGYHAKVEGVMEKIELTEEQALARAEHHAEEQGLEFDPASVTGPAVIYQLRGLGAEIEDPPAS